MATLCDQNHHQPIPPTGLTVVVDPSDPSLDIIFIHGFTGHPERTWTHKQGDRIPKTHCEIELSQPPSKIRKLGLFSKNQGDYHTAVFWPRDLIPSTVPNARVLTYGYDTHIRHRLGSPVNRNTVYDIAWDLLVALEAGRREEPSRPALFIAHSLGGIVVKEMLRRSSGCHRVQTHLRAIFESTIGIMFFGTPHGGADPRGILQHIAEKAIKAAGFSVNEQIVNTLLPSAERLRELRDDFGPMAQEQNWNIHSFQEQLGVSLLSGHKVVEDVSSYLNDPSIEITEHIGRNHMEMCRFTGPNDVEYQKFESALRRIAKLNPNCLRTGPKPSLNEDQLTMLMDSLRFDQIDARQMGIKKAHAKTCKWLLKKSEYLNWQDFTKLDEHHGFLWIKGKHGAGKSTLMKFALANARKTMKEWIVISFFFNARGETLEKSTIGTYRSLLLQLLEKLPALQCVFDSLDFSTSSATSRQWSLESLKALLEQAIQSLGKSSVVCFIDALDECDEREIRDMISFFEHVSELAVSAGIRFQVCFSSRHYPHISIRKGLELVLEGQEGHSQDITNYLDSELRIGHSKAAEQIRTEVQEKASGVFMWVVLVVEILNKEYDRGRIHALRRRLQEIPSDLHELFRDILVRDSHNRKELVQCVQWVLFARQPLSPEQLYFAILSGVEPDGLSRWDPDQVTIDVMKRFILDSSKGLVEITASKTPKAQFIHESVRDFLLKEDGIGSIWVDLGRNFQGQSHEQLKNCCCNYINMAVSTVRILGINLPKASSDEVAIRRKLATAEFPFLEYTVRKVLYHADAAAGSGIPEKEFIQNFQLSDWVKLNNLFEKYDVRRYTPNVNLMYILAESNMSNLVRIHPDIFSYLNTGDERYGIPLFASLATGSFEAVQSFLDAYAMSQPSNIQLGELFTRYQQDRSRHRSLGRDFKLSTRRTALSYLAELGDEVLCGLLLETGRFPPDSKDADGRTPFWYAIMGDHETVAKLLLKTGKVDVNSEDSNGQALLSWLVTAGREAPVRLLLKLIPRQIHASLVNAEWPTVLQSFAYLSRERCNALLELGGGFDVNQKGFKGQTALSFAARNGNERMVKLLLETGNIDVDVKDFEGRTPLSLAAANGNETVVELLLKTGNIDVDVKDSEGHTPLSWAAYYGNEAVVKLLLKTNKVDVNSKCSNGRTPLAWAAINGNEAVVKLLLETDEVDINSRDRERQTPLLLAAQRGNKAIVKLLLETGKTDVNSEDYMGRSALSWAVNNKQYSTASLLKRYGGIGTGLQG